MTDRAPEVAAALADPETFRTWQGERRRTLTALILWTLGLVAYAVLGSVAVADLGVSRLVVGIVAVPVVLVLVMGLVAANLRWEQLGVIRGVLETYPWRELPPIGSAHPAGIEYFQLPDPDQPAKKVSVTFRHFGRGRRWQRAVTEARSTGSTYAGDPRFACVVSTPHALLAVRPQHVYATDPDTQPDSVSEAAWSLARTARITAPPSDQEKFRRLLYSIWKSSRNREAR